MKKVVSVLLVFVFAICLSGCGNKKLSLECKRNAQGVDITLSTSVVGNLAASMNINYFSNLSNRTDEEIASFEKQDFCSAIKESMPDYKDAFGECKSKIDKTKKDLNIDIKIDVDKLGKNKSDKMGDVETMKESFEAQGYSCTIKK